MAFASLPNPIVTLLFLLLFVIFSKADDGSVMAKFAASISPARASWTGAAFCNWSGVECDDNGRVTSITLLSQSLAGTLPSNLNLLSELTTLSLQGNRFSGELPSFSNLANLQQLYVDNNNFSSIPAAAFSGLSSLQIITLGSNPNFPPWTFPSELTQSTGITHLYAASCNLIGSIPDIFDSFPNLMDLQLAYNSLTGVVPPSLTALPNLVNVSLNNNKLQGLYPLFNARVKAEIGTSNNFCTDKPGAACDAQVTALIAVAGAFGYPMTLAEFWGGNNACNQWRFISCNSYGNVTSVILTKQALNGSISPAFAELTYLRNLYLNDNNLNGTIPENLTTLADLQVLDVSNNNLSGQVPKFRTGVTVNYKGNSFIGTDIDSGGGGNSSSDGVTSKKSSISVGLVVGLVIGVIVLVGIMLFVLYKCYLRKRDSKFGDHNEMRVFEGGNAVISIQVLRQVTNNFSDENILGKGGFGVVYKGELHDGTKIAVKRINTTKGMNEFQAEIAVLTRAKHRHLVALLGYCINEDEKILVYEYMPQGTLAQHLFEWRELDFHPLTWKERVTIALDVARGVEYLHSLAQSSFIHRDLKPTNILLGDDMRAKVGDFGLVKNAPNGNSSTSTQVAGTFGYLAPEYAATGRVSTKVDVYSFGVILMELITARKALDNSMPEDSCHLATWFRRILMNKDNIRNVIDDVLVLDDEAYECILKVAELARHCTADKPYQRPDIGHAVNVLAPLVKQWIPRCQEEEESFGFELFSLPQSHTW